MQDGTPVHCMTDANKFPAENFRGRVISRGTDLNPFNFYFWAVAQRRVYEVKPSTIPKFINVVKFFASEISEDVLEKVALEVLDRARLCFLVNGCHFKKLTKINSTR